MGGQNNAVIKAPEKSPLYGLASRFNIEPSKLIQVLKGTVIKPDSKGKEATNEEVAAFCIVAQQYDLNPFTREIHAFTSNGAVVPIVGVDGWAHIINSRGEFDGCEFDEATGEKGEPESITCRMYVKGRTHPVAVTERFIECKRNTAPWNTMPWRMLRHKAFMQAGRYAFGLSGIYDEDEARDIIRNASAGPGGRDPVDMPRPITYPAPEEADVEFITEDGEVLQVWRCGSDVCSWRGAERNAKHNADGLPICPHCGADCSPLGDDTEG